MGFRTGAYAKVWDMQPASDTRTRIRISISRKNKQTDKYETDFSGFVTCVGTAAASAALKLKEGDRIKLGDCDVTTRWEAEKKIQYTNFALFSFTVDDGVQQSGATQTEPATEVDNGEINDDDLPF